MSKIRKIIEQANRDGWIADHRTQYLADGDAGHIWDSSVTGGPGPVPTLLLTTIGRKSGRESIMPMIYGEVADGYAVIASKGGDEKHPGWYHNLMAQDEVQVQVANDVFRATHRIASGDERSAIWKQMMSIYPLYDAYQSRTSREIPVVVLIRQ
jgi:deazaflavin-dependent oxidoreductase (nitroreductase family)